MIPSRTEDSTREQREKYIKEVFQCRSDCDNCGTCKVLRSKTPEVAYADYIVGKREFAEVAADYR